MPGLLKDGDASELHHPDEDQERTNGDAVQERDYTQPAFERLRFIRTADTIATNIHRFLRP